VIFSLGVAALSVFSARLAREWFDGDEAAKNLVLSALSGFLDYSLRRG
jgi:hypothetical protein